MYDLIKQMHHHFQIAYEGEPRQLPQDEFDFRIKAFREEIQEYIDAYEAGNIEEQFDALIDLIVFAMGACEKHGFDLPSGFARVMRANMAKEVVTNASESKRGHSTDLKKPEGWRAPYLKDLISPPNKYSGIIILEGPDGCGKTTLAEHFVENYGAHYMHSTWSEGLEKRMDEYMHQTLMDALDIAQNRLVVLDRHFLSELVYADAYRGGSSRGNMHLHTHSVIQIEQIPASVIICLPRCADLANTQFESLRDSREEMYDDISDVVKAYEALWLGDESVYTFKGGREYVDLVMAHGGLKEGKRFIRYDWTSEGANMKAFCEHMLNPVTEESIND